MSNIFDITKYDVKKVKWENGISKPSDTAQKLLYLLDN